MSKDGCRFDPLAPDRSEPIVNDTGYPNSWHYRCTLCARYHWCIPALEIDGSEDDEESCFVAMDAAVSGFYGGQVPVSFACPAPEWP